MAIQIILCLIFEIAFIVNIVEFWIKITNKSKKKNGWEIVFFCQ